MWRSGAFELMRTWHPVNFGEHIPLLLPKCRYAQSLA